ncbi:MAG: hypothetical protein EOP78_02190 [Variovorax sp.]|nr:MAG: hypothetical protein EOP78_02190 [Variovorax sp.]
METLPSEVWIAACAHRLHRQWHSVDPDDLEQMASMLLRDSHFAAMAPDEAAAEWLTPVASAAQSRIPASRRAPQEPSHGH